MAITVTAPLGQVTNVVPTAGSGGNLTADTWYFRVCAANTSSYTLMTADQRRSPVSDEVSVAVGANGSVSLTWTAVTGATHYNVYARKSSEADYVGRHCYPAADQLVATCSTTSFTFNDTAKRGGVFDTFAMSPSYMVPGGIDRNLGTIVVHCSGALNTLRYDDIKTAVDAAGCSGYMTWTGTEAVLKGQLIIDSGATGQMYMYSPKITSSLGYATSWHFLNGWIINNSTTFTVAWGIDGNGASCNVEMWSWRLDLQNTGNCRHMKVNGTTHTGMYQSSYCVGGDNYVYIKATTGDTFGMMIRGINLEYYKNISDISVFPLMSPVATGLVATRVDCGFAAIVSTITGSTEFNDCRFWTSGGSYSSAHIRSRNNFTQGIYLYDCKFWDIANSNFKEYPDIYWDTVSGKLNQINVGNTFDIKVVNGSGTAINGATVTLLDKTGTQVFSVQTGADGKIATQKAVKRTYISNGTDGINQHTYTDKFPFTLVIGANGYESNVTVTSPTSKFNEEISLLTRETELTEVTEIMPNVYEEV